MGFELSNSMTVAGEGPSTSSYKNSKVFYENCIGCINNNVVHVLKIFSYVTLKFPSLLYKKFYFMI